MMDLLKKVPCFSSLDDATLQLMEEVFELASFKAGDVLLHAPLEEEGAYFFEDHSNRIIEDDTFQNIHEFETGKRMKELSNSVNL